MKSAAEPRNALVRLLASMVLVLSLGSVSSRSFAQTPDLEIEEVGRFDFVGGDSPDPRRVAEGLSGIAHVSGDQFLAVSDMHPYLHRIAIEVDSVTGRILSARFGEPLRLTDSLGFDFPEPHQGLDREGVVYDPSTDSVWISNERTGSDTTMPSIARHLLETGEMTDIVVASDDGPLHVFSHIVFNLGFESLARSPDGTEFWTANEQALTVDGSWPTTTEGAVVRLQRFDGRFQPVAQYAYVTAPLSATTPPEIVEEAISGVVDLLALPGGALLVQERAVVGGPAGEPTVRIRIYEVDFAGATDISRRPWASGLVDAAEPYAPVEKRLLVELTSGTGTNFNLEGLALGPRLEGGDHSLILIADNGTGTSQTLYALRLGGLDLAPSFGRVQEVDRRLLVAAAKGDPPLHPCAARGGAMPGSPD